ncbi:rnhA operon protein [Natronolimnohabitans sp. A-GB9]|uniref:DUF7108 family protein n=1 Tax=Natronolimnohabitans sp. A-GB9 TaxID=3069757 RepID=UPI0027AF757F|nr:rnhA operon protein [Natronolimnohabitans sp. A-GB9]MDQ2049633.1 rnhA operon protein [Natronolimnohabitans sp. A-GB9]
MTESNESLEDADQEFDASEATTEASETGELPTEVIDEAERLTRLARRTPDENEADAYVQRRATLLEEYKFTARIRDDDGDDTLVLYPAEWRDADEGVIRTDRIEDTSRAVEIPLEGTGDPDDWDDVDDHNRELVDRVRERHGDVHGDNAAVLADFVGNHYAKRIEELTAAELREFRTEYFVRNAWPSAAQRAAIDDSIEFVYETAGKPVPDRQDR